MNVEDLKQAIEAAQAIPDNSAKATELSAIAIEFVKSGLEKQGLEILEEALQLAQNLENADDRDLTLCDVALAYGQVGQYELAIEISQLVVTDDIRALIHVLLPLVQKCLSLRQPDQVWRLLRAAQGSNFEASVVCDVLDHYIKVGDMGHAYRLIEYSHQLAQRLDSPDWKIFVLTHLARAHFSIGQNDKGLELLREANAIAEGVKDYGSGVFVQDIVDSFYAKYSQPLK
jgi:tetratricopeptide (TPR) repeat protein